MSPDSEKISVPKAIETDTAEVIKKPVTPPIEPDDEDNDDGPRSVTKYRDLSDVIAVSGVAQTEGEPKKSGEFMPQAEPEA